MEYLYFWITLIVCLWSTFLPHVHCRETYVDETALLTTLQSGYKQSIRPSTPTEVSMFYSIRTLQSLDITLQSMSTTGWISLYWNDPRLIWNATDYSNITELDANWIWRPEFFIVNSANGISYNGYENDKVRFRVFNTGTVRWTMPLLLTTTCDVNIAMFPFDSQSCYIEVLFLGMNSIDLATNISNEINTFAYIENAEWQFDSSYVSTQSIPVCCPVSLYTMVYFSFSFTRLRPFYVINLIVPAMILSACMVLTFLLPTDCGERLGYSMTILLSYTVLMTITSEMMPTTSKQTPYINMYLLILLVLCAMTVVSVVVSVRMFYLQSKPPKLLQKICRKLSLIIFLKRCKRKQKVMPAEYDVKGKDDNLNIPQLKSEGENTVVEDEVEEITWQDLAELQDRLCFYIYSIAGSLLIIIFVLALHGVI